MTPQVMWGFCIYHLSPWEAGPKPLSQKGEGPPASESSLCSPLPFHLPFPPPYQHTRKTACSPEVRSLGPTHLIISMPSAFRVLTFENQKLFSFSCALVKLLFPWYNKWCLNEVRGRGQGNRSCQRGKFVHILKTSLFQCPHHPSNLVHPLSRGQSARCILPDNNYPSLFLCLRRISVPGDLL